MVTFPLWKYCVYCFALRASCRQKAEGRRRKEEFKFQVEVKEKDKRQKSQVEERSDEIPQGGNKSKVQYKYLENRYSGLTFILLLLSFVFYLPLDCVHEILFSPVEQNNSYK